MPLHERLSDSILLATMLIVAYTDWKHHKIFNWTTFSGMLAGLTIRGGMDGWNGLKFSLIGLGVGLAIQIIPFWLNAVKGGDVKLLMMVGALQGWQFVSFGFLYGAAFFLIVGGIWLAVEGTLLASLRNIADFFKTVGVYQTATEPAPPASRKMLPWGISLALGFLVALAMKHVFGSASLVEIVARP